MLGFKVLMVWTWTGWFWMLTWRFSKINLQQCHWYGLMWQFARGGIWVGENFPSWSSVMSCKILIGWTWKGWFCRMTWWFLKFHMYQYHHCWQHVTTLWDPYPGNMVQSFLRNQELDKTCHNLGPLVILPCLVSNVSTEPTAVW